MPLRMLKLFHAGPYALLEKNNPNCKKRKRTIAEVRMFWFGLEEIPNRLHSKMATISRNAQTNSHTGCLKYNPPKRATIYIDAPVSLFIKSSIPLQKCYF